MWWTFAATPHARRMIPGVEILCGVEQYSLYSSYTALWLTTSRNLPVTAASVPCRLTQMSYISCGLWANLVSTLLCTAQCAELVNTGITDNSHMGHLDVLASVISHWRISFCTCQTLAGFWCTGGGSYDSTRSSWTAVFIAVKSCGPARGSWSGDGCVLHAA